jgi:hypothetical protein|tara:strand:+ start:967 stop:1740 length:774 start_codon:yes stop_codon:yes gene_type:complete
VTGHLLRVELTYPGDPVREDEFNDWYSGSRIPDLLNSRGWLGATRFRLGNAPIGNLSPYLTLYYIEAEDPEAAERALAEQLAKKNSARKPEPKVSGEQHAGLVAVDTIAYYSKTLEVGQNERYGSESPPAIMVTLTFPARGTPVREMNDWYDAHVGDIITTSGFSGVCRYELAKMVTGHSSPYIAIYELETEDVDLVARSLDDNRDRWLAGDTSSQYYDNSGPMPNTVNGERWIGVDGFAYYLLVDSFGSKPDSGDS